MFKKNDTLYVVHYKGYYMSSRDYKTVDALNLDSDIKEATVFKSLKRAKFWAKKIDADVLVYNHDETLLMHDDTQSTETSSDEVHP